MCDDMVVELGAELETSAAVFGIPVNEYVDQCERNARELGISFRELVMDSFEQALDYIKRDAERKF